MYRALRTWPKGRHCGCVKQSPHRIVNQQRETQQRRRFEQGEEIHMLPQIIKPPMEHLKLIGGDSDPFLRHRLDKDVFNPIYLWRKREPWP